MQKYALSRELFFIFYEIFDRRLNSQHNYIIVPIICHLCEEIIEIAQSPIAGRMRARAQARAHSTAAEAYARKGPSPST